MLNPVLILFAFMSQYTVLTFFIFTHKLISSIIFTIKIPYLTQLERYLPS